MAGRGVTLGTDGSASGATLRRGDHYRFWVPRPVETSLGTPMSSERRTIIYTHTDEAPALATRSLLPVVNAFTDVAGVEVELRDISLAGRVLATFPDALTPEQRITDDLAELGRLVTKPEANV